MVRKVTIICLAVSLTLGLMLFSSSGVQKAHAAEPVVIGVPTSLYTPFGSYGLKAVNLAVEEINAKGGVLGRPLELVRRDDESNPAKGLTAARELIQREKVAVLLGGLDTPVQLAIVPFVNNVKIGRAHV